MKFCHLSLTSIFVPSHTFYKAYFNYSMNDLPVLDRTKLPKHIAIIMDGNGRWAKERNEERLYGHYEGVISVRDVVNACGEIGIDYLTLYAFSTENWNRPKNEVDALMELLVNTLRKEIDELHKNNVRMHVIGDMKSMPDICQKELNEAIDITKDNTGVNLILALSYSSRWEILEAGKKFAKDVKTGKYQPEDLNDALFQSYLETGNFPDPELMIRTSGEHRISNYLLYQLAYAELYFTNVHWPDFRKPHLIEAIANYQQRERRFGKTSDQIQTNPPQHAQ
jgi:undecaprenyl diphosphate synthase